MLRPFLAVALLVLVTAPAYASCPDPIMAFEAARPAVTATFAELNARYDFPWGQTHVYGKLEATRITLAEPYERLSALQKRQAIDYLHLGGLPATLRQPTPYDELTAGTPMTPYTVVAHDGRIVSLPYDACTRLSFFTELDREKLRFKGRIPPARVNRFPLTEAMKQGMTDTCWAAVGKKQPDILHFAWVPERGHFEIVVAMSARWHYQNRLAQFRFQAPWDFHYVVLDADGGWLEEWGVLPPPWQ